MQHRDVQYYLSGIGVEWRFNLPRAPCWGGVFEHGENDQALSQEACWKS